MFTINSKIILFLAFNWKTTFWDFRPYSNVIGAFGSCRGSRLLWLVAYVRSGNNRPAKLFGFSKFKLTSVSGLRLRGRLTQTEFSGYYIPSILYVIELNGLSNNKSDYINSRSPFLWQSQVAELLPICHNSGNGQLYNFITNGNCDNTFLVNCKYIY